MAVRYLPDIVQEKIGNGMDPRVSFPSVFFLGISKSFREDFDTNMGNCLVHRDKIVKVMKIDGKIIEYKPPMQVHELLAEFEGHAVCDKLPISQHLHPSTKMRSGTLYYLLPPGRLMQKSTEVEWKVTENSSPTVRIKMVMTKKELKEMLAKSGLKGEELITGLQSLQSKPRMKDADDEADSSERFGLWRPALESIPE
ncbi:uncharacterized protein [Aristolochia californica]|uniref:uncharacterized protein n=1 Tax=Aristolochia californica TaxID=171875 RepID=UPI0035E0BAD7